MANTYQKFSEATLARGKNPVLLLSGIMGLIVLGLVCLILLVTGTGNTPASSSGEGESVPIYRGRIGPYNLVVNRLPQVPTPDQPLHLEFDFPDNPQPLNFDIKITPVMTGMPMPAAVDIKAAPKSNNSNIYLATFPVDMEGLWILNVSMMAPASSTPLTPYLHRYCTKTASAMAFNRSGYCSGDRDCSSGHLLLLEQRKRSL